MENPKSVDLVLYCGVNTAIDSFSQVQSLVTSLNKNSDDISKRSIKSSVTLLLFSILESYTSFLSNLTVDSNNELYSDAPKIKGKLHTIEEDLLKEQQTIYDTKKRQVKVKKNNYVPVLEKLCIVPALLAKLYGVEFSIDKGRDDWRYLEDLKKCRDNITHPKFDFESISLSPNYETVHDMTTAINHTKQFYNIEEESILKGTLGIKWYLNEVNKLLQIIYNENILQTTLNSVDLFANLTLLKINKQFNILSSKEFKSLVKKKSTIEIHNQNSKESSLYLLTKN
ncbi:TPA: hypothetical protein QCN45_003555 [Bacillus cereus]|nr:hypothetical protein [Bacillus cereus]